MTSRSARFKKIVAVLAGTAVAAVVASVPTLLQAAPESSSQESPAGGSEGQNPSVQESESFELATRESMGQEGKRVRIGDTHVVFNSIFDFAESANDLFVWGWLPTVSGDIADNAFLGGQKVDISPEGTIGGDLFLFAQTSRIDGHIGGDLYAFVAELTITEDATIDGAIYGSSAALTLDGVIGGPIRFAGGTVTLNGTVNGDVRLEAGELQIGPNAVIEGDLRYESPRPGNIDPAAQVRGATQHFVPQDDDEDEDNAVATARGWFSLWDVLWDGWWLLSSFIVGVFALAVGGDHARKPAESLAQQPALGLGFGFVVAVVFPAAALLAMILLVTLPLGLIGLALYVAAAYLARLVAAQAVGDWLLRAARGGTQSSAYASLAVGLVLFYVLTRIPYVGFLVWLAAVVGGLGGIFLASRRSPSVSGEAPIVAAGQVP